MPDHFKDLVHFLKQNGFQVYKPKYHKEKWRFAIAKNDRIEAGFAEPNNGESFRYIDGHFAADNQKCFNKWSHCPLVVRIPETQQEREKLLEYLEFLASDEGYEWSTHYRFYDDPKLPREVT